MEPRPLTDDEKAAIRSSYHAQCKATEAILSTWSDSDLRDVIEAHLWRTKDAIDFIVQEELVLDDLDSYFDFDAYPEHYVALVKAGIIKDVAPPPSPTVSAADMEGQPKLIEDAP